MEDTMPKKKKSIGMGVLLILVTVLGIVLFGFGVKGALERYHQKQYYQTVRGIIKEVYVHKGENGSKTYNADYYYEIDGTGYILNDKVSDSNEPQAGRPVEIHYDPEAPENAYVEGKVAPYNVLLLMGIMFACVPFAIFLSEYVTLSDRASDLVNGLLFGFAFSGLGFGLLFVVKPDDILSTGFLFLFGCLGLYMLGYTVYRAIIGK